MTTNYQSVVKFYLEQHRTEYSLPEWIERKWRRIYTELEEKLDTNSCPIASDVFLPNSIVRTRLNNDRNSIEINVKTLSDELALPIDFQRTALNDEEFNEMKSSEFDTEPTMASAEKQQTKRKRNQHVLDDEQLLEPFSMREILEELHTHLGNELKIDEIQQIQELMKVIGRHQQDQVFSIYDELVDAQLIHRFGGVPKLVQALQEIQRVFEQVTMKTNLASIQTIIDHLQEQDQTYFLALELSKKFNESKRKAPEIDNQSGEIPENEQRTFEIFIKDRIEHLPTTQAVALLKDLASLHLRPSTEISSDRDVSIRQLTEDYEKLLRRAHLNGIKSVLRASSSSIGRSLEQFLVRIEKSLRIKLNENDYLLIEQLIDDHLKNFNSVELKSIYEHLAQQGTIERQRQSTDARSTLLKSVKKKLRSDGLGALIENLTDFTELRDLLEEIHNYLQSSTSLPLGEIEKELKISYSIETQTRSNVELDRLLRSIDLYSIHRLPLQMTISTDDRTVFLEQSCAPLTRFTMKQIFERINRESNVDLHQVSNEFYQQEIEQLFRELLDGSTRLNRSFLVQKLKEKFHNQKDSTEKLYRLMIKENFIDNNPKQKRNNEKKKIAAIIARVNDLFQSNTDGDQQRKFIQLLKKIDLIIPESIERWYERGPITPTMIQSTSNDRKRKNLKKTFVQKKEKNSPRLAKSVPMNVTGLQNLAQSVETELEPFDQRNLIEIHVEKINEKYQKTFFIGQTGTTDVNLLYEKSKSTQIVVKELLESSPRKTDSPTNEENSQPLTVSNESSQIREQRPLNKIENVYINSLTKSLQQLFTRTDYNSTKLRQIHEELISSGHISPLNEFYRSANEALRVTLDHCLNYDDLIKWTLSLFQTTKKPNLIEFARDLYSIAVQLDFALAERVDLARCSIELQEQIKQQMQNFSENDLRGKSMPFHRLLNLSNDQIFEEINSYINASPNLIHVHQPKKLNVTSFDRMSIDLHRFLINLIESSHSMEPKFRPIQNFLRSVSDQFKSRTVSNLVRKIDEIEKSFAKTFGITLIGLSERLSNKRSSNH